MTNVLWPNGSKTKPAVSSPYGRRSMPGAYSNFHYGCDFIGFDIGRSVLDGTVTLAGPYTAQSGVSVAVDSLDPITGKPVTIVYMHASKVLVSKGQKVKAGDPLINVGHTGNATGNCDHTEIRYWAGGKFTTVDPEKMIPAWMQHVAATPADVKPGKRTRQVGLMHVNGRTNASTNFPIRQTLKPHVVGTFDGYKYGQSVEGNDVWFRGAFNHNWFWSGGFTNQSPNGLPLVK